MRRQFFPTAVAALALGAAPAAADVWDLQTNNDDTPATRNELVHGTSQIHDVENGSQDLDFYMIGQKPYSSYEVVVDSASGDFGAIGARVHRRAADGITTLQDSQPITPGPGQARSLRWANTTGAVENSELILVYGGLCNPFCNSADVYHIRFYETTTSVARFNNSGSQITVLLVQNPTDYPVTGVVYYWDTAGALIAESTLSLGPKGLYVTLTNGPAPGVGGSITIAHDARYGDLKGKAVALEPSTGFSFDSPMEHRPR